MKLIIAALLLLTSTDLMAKPIASRVKYKIICTSQGINELNQALDNFGI